MQTDFAIITIRSDEFAAVLQRFPTKVQKGSGGRTYGISEIHTRTGENCQVAVVRCSEQGNDVAQQIANDVIADLDPQMILVVGIAGGVPHSDFTLGDVVVSTRIVNLNVSKRFEDGREEFDTKSGIHPKISDVTASLQLYQKELAGWNSPAAIGLDLPRVNLRWFETGEFHAQIADGHKNASWYKNVRTSITTHFASNGHLTRPPLFQTGTIASSNSVIREIDPLVQWLQTTRSILAVEMESAGIYQATQRIHHQYPFMAIRGISDIIGFEREEQWTKYACHTAAAFAHAFVTTGIITPREIKSSANNRIKLAEESLLHGDYDSAYREIDTLIRGFSDELQSQDLAKLKYLEALVHLEGRRPYVHSLSVMQLVERLLRAAYRLHSLHSYMSILAVFKYDFARNGFPTWQAEANDLINRARELALQDEDHAHIALLAHTQPELFRNYRGLLPFLQ